MYAEQSRSLSLSLSFNTSTCYMCNDYIVVVPVVCVCGHNTEAKSRLFGSHGDSYRYSLVVLYFSVPCRVANTSTSRTKRTLKRFLQQHQNCTATKSFSTLRDTRVHMYIYIIYSRVLSSTNAQQSLYCGLFHSLFCIGHSRVNHDKAIQ